MSNIIGEVKLNTARATVREDYYSYQQNGSYISGASADAPIIEGYFFKENLMKEMAIRKLNMSLCMILCALVVVAFVSYYFEMSNEIVLNTLSRQVTALNDENSELQNHLDKLKSFNNVDSKMAQQNLLQKAAKVIEVPAVVSNVDVESKKERTSAVDWSIGY